LSELFIEVECGFNDVNIQIKIEHILKYYDDDNDSSIGILDVDKLFHEDIEIPDVSEISILNNGRLYFTIHGAIYDTYVFWKRLSNIILNSGSNYIFSLTHNSQVGVYSVEIKEGNNLKIIYITGEGGELDSTFIYQDDESLFERCKKIFSKNVDLTNNNRSAYLTETKGSRYDDSKLKLNVKKEVQYKNSTENLFSFAKSGNLGALQAYVDDGFDINIKNDSCKTALIIACRERHYEVVEYLLSVGANLNDKDIIQRSALSEAAKNEDTKIMSLLLEYGADPEGKILFDASTTGKLYAVKTLLSAGADPNFRFFGFNTPLSVAAESGYTGIVKELIDAGLKKSLKGNKLALTKAAENGHFDIVKLLVDRLKIKVDPNPVNGSYEVESPLQMAAKNGHIKVIEYLLEKGADIEYSCFGTNTPLSLASEEGHVHVVNSLLKHSADPNGLGRPHEGSRFPPVYNAAGKKGSELILKALLQAGAMLEIEYNLKDFSPKKIKNPTNFWYHIMADHILERAVGANNIELVKYMINLPEINIDTFPNESHSLTPLIIAAAKGYFDMVILLVENGANIQHVCFYDAERRIPSNEYGPLIGIYQAPLTAIYQAMINGHSEIVEYLYEKGAAPEAKSITELNTKWRRSLERRLMEVRKKYINETE
jgi:ankyrin repeat protein